MVRQRSGCTGIPNGSMGKDRDLDGYENRIERLRNNKTYDGLLRKYQVFMVNLIKLQILALNFVTN